jgi:hypothetical protein
MNGPAFPFRIRRHSKAADAARATRIPAAEAIR